MPAFPTVVLMVFLGACAATGAWMSAVMVVWSAHRRIAAGHARGRAPRRAARRRGTSLYLILVLGFVLACVATGALSGDWFALKIALVLCAGIVLIGFASIGIVRLAVKPGGSAQA
ncbi:MAG TPA: hypothetical protein VFQ96_01840 [Microbacteriaceae bacterium]|nr:hypothetical protein [Microbacteriaceae bacterium]